MEARAVAYRPTLLQSALAGAVVALAAGLWVGGYLKAGDRFPNQGPATFSSTFGQEAPEPISFMTDASGRIPDYVLGADFIAARDGLPQLVEAAWQPDEPVVQSIQVAYAAPSEPEPWTTAPPPSLGGDILAIGAAAEPTHEAAVSEPLSVPPEERSEPVAYRPLRVSTSTEANQTAAAGSF